MVRQLCFSFARGALGVVGAGLVLWPGPAVPAQPSEDRLATISGEVRQWHPVTLDLKGPLAREGDTAPNPFLDYRLTVTFEHESGEPRYVVPGYFAADGRAAETGAEAGDVWRAHLSPDKTGRWHYRVSFVRGPGVAVSDAPGEPVAPLDGVTGRFDVAPTDKSGRDFRAKGPAPVRRRPPPALRGKR